MNKRSHFFRILVLMTLIVSGCSQEANREQDDIAAIKEIFDKYSSFVDKKDLDGIISIWEENGIRSEPGIPSIIGKENIRARFEELIMGPFNHRIIPLGEQMLEVSGDIAYSYRAFTIASTPVEGGETVQQDAKVLTIYRRQSDNSWKIYIDCINFHPTWSMDSIPSELTEKNPYY